MGGGWAVEDGTGLGVGSGQCKALETLAGISKKPEQQHGGIKPAHA